MRTYGHYCAVAKALDVIGDRWALLIIRELTIQGSCRFTDLQRGLPGIATNLLTARLRDLERTGIVQRGDAPPPVATALYSLTEAGTELGPVLVALGRWGTRYMDAPSPAEQFRGHWLSFPVEQYLADSEPDGRPLAIEVLVNDEAVVIDVADGTIATRLGRSTHPDVVLEGGAPAVVGVLTGRLTDHEARALGLQVRGDLGVLRRLRRGWDAANLLAPAQLVE